MAGEFASMQLRLAAPADLVYIPALQMMGIHGILGKSKSCLCACVAVSTYDRLLSQVAHDF